MKKFVFLFFLLPFFLRFLISPHSAFAHFPATDGDMTVTLHVDPDDDPTPGQQANLYFLFDYSGKSFSVTQCYCVVTVYEQKKEIFQQQLSINNDKQPSIWGVRVPFDFPQNDVYHIALKGKPKHEDTFQSFALSWDFRVDPDNGDTGIVIQRHSDLPYLLGAVGVGIIFLALFGWFVKSQIIDSEDKKTK